MRNVTRRNCPHSHTSTLSLRLPLFAALRSFPVFRALSLSPSLSLSLSQLVCNSCLLRQVYLRCNENQNIVSMYVRVSHLHIHSHCLTHLFLGTQKCIGSLSNFVTFEQARHSEPSSVWAKLSQVSSEFQQVFRIPFYVFGFRFSVLIFVFV